MMLRGLYDVSLPPPPPAAPSNTEASLPGTLGVGRGLSQVPPCYEFVARDRQFSTKSVAGGQSLLHRKAHVEPPPPPPCVTSAGLPPKLHTDTATGPSKRRGRTRSGDVWRSRSAGACASVSTGTALSRGAGRRRHEPRLDCSGRSGRALGMVGWHPRSPPNHVRSLSASGQSRSPLQSPRALAADTWPTRAASPARTRSASAGILLRSNACPASNRRSARPAGLCASALRFTGACVAQWRPSTRVEAVGQLDRTVIAHPHARTPPPTNCCHRPRH